jgi:ethanolamine utilization protein EutQ (cupin superfamily)
MSMAYRAAELTKDLPSMNVEDSRAWLGDVFSSDDANKTITCGFFRLERSKALDYFYTYDEMKFVVDGEFIVTDETGAQQHATKGDVLYFRKGSKIRFETPTHGVGFFCGQRREGEG